MFDDFSFSRSRDITGAPKFEMGHVTLSVPLLFVIFLYAGTWLGATREPVQTYGWCPPKFNDSRDMTTPLSWDS